VTLMIRRSILDRAVERGVPALPAQQFSRDVFRIIVGADDVGKQSFEVPNPDYIARDRPRSFHNRSATLFEGGSVVTQNRLGSDS
jgi:hypothetical protein